MRRLNTFRRRRRSSPRGPGSVPTTPPHGRRCCYYTTKNGVGISCGDVFTEYLRFVTRESRNTAKLDKTIFGRWLTDSEEKTRPQNRIMAESCQTAPKLIPAFLGVGGCPLRSPAQSKGAVMHYLTVRSHPRPRWWRQASASCCAITVSMRSPLVLGEFVLTGSIIFCLTPIVSVAEARRSPVIEAVEVINPTPSIKMT